MKNLAERLEALIPTIRARSEEIERMRRLPRDLVDSLRDTGMFSLEIPRSLGGQEAEPTEILRAVETVSMADGSTGWCAMIATANNGTSGMLNEIGAAEVFKDSTAPTAGIFAPTGAAIRVDGGVRVNGRWQFASGVTHCEWIWLGCVVMENGQPRLTPMGPEVIQVFAPVRDVEVHDTWFVSGLCGTGSNDVSAKDLFVPERRIMQLLIPPANRSESIYHMPALGWFSSHVGAVSLGLARGALDQLVELSQKKVPSMSTAVLADRAAAQLDIARAEAATAAARAFLYQSVEDLWKAVRAGKQATARQIALNRMAAAHAVETGALVTRTANVLAGGSSIFAASSLQRFARDAEAILHHFTVAPHIWEDAGRTLLGRPIVAPIF